MSYSFNFIHPLKRKIDGSNILTLNISNSKQNSHTGVNVIEADITQLVEFTERTFVSMLNRCFKHSARQFEWFLQHELLKSYIGFQI